MWFDCMAEGAKCKLKIKKKVSVCCRLRKDDTQPLPCQNPGVQCCGLDLRPPPDLIMCTAADPIDLCRDP